MWCEILVEKGLNYYRDFVLPNKKFRNATSDERNLFGSMRDRLADLDADDEETLQAIPFEVARHSGVEPKELFRSFYEVMLGQERGPRFGSFVKLVGRDRVLTMLAEKSD